MKNSLFVLFLARHSKLFGRGQIRSNTSERGGLIRCKIVILPKLGRKIEANLFDVAANGVVVAKGVSRIPMGLKLYKQGLKKTYECEKCGLKIDRDVNGARNNLLEKLQELIVNEVHQVRPRVN